MRLMSRIYFHEEWIPKRRKTEKKEKAIRRGDFPLVEP